MGTRVRDAVMGNAHRQRTAGVLSYVHSQVLVSLTLDRDGATTNCAARATGVLPAVGERPPGAHAPIGGARNGEHLSPQCPQSCCFRDGCSLGVRSLGTAEASGASTHPASHPPLQEDFRPPFDPVHHKEPTRRAGTPPAVIEEVHDDGPTPPTTSCPSRSAPIVEEPDDGEQVAPMNGGWPVCLISVPRWPRRLCGGGDGGPPRAAFPLPFAALLP